MNGPVNSASGNDPHTDDWLTIPNMVTFVRFLLVPVFGWLMFYDEYWHALIILIVLFSTDWIDGFLARKLNQVSSVGKWLDPLADRLSLWVVITTVVLAGLAPIWLVFALVVPDLVMGALMMIVYAGTPHMEVTILGKARTAALMLGVPLLLFAEAPFTDAALWYAIATSILAVGAGGHILAAIDYITKGIRGANGMRKAGLNPRNKGHRNKFVLSV